MELIPLKTDRLEPGCDLADALEHALDSAGEHVRDGDILIVASKAVSLAENRLANAGDLEDLVRREAEQVFGEGKMVMTLKNKMLIPNAGIDSSNVPEGKVILWPRDPFQSARKLRVAFDLRNFGVIIADSGIRPLRRGTQGVSIGWAGFEGVSDERGKPDLFGKTLVHTQVGIADNLAAAAEAVMGSTDASVPFVIARGAQAVFTDREFRARDYYMDSEECLFRGIMSESF